MTDVEKGITESEEDAEGQLRKRLEAEGAEDDAQGHKKSRFTVGPEDDAEGHIKKG